MSGRVTRKIWSIDAVLIDPEILYGVKFERDGLERVQ